MTSAAFSSMAPGSAARRGQTVALQQVYTHLEHLAQLRQRFHALSQHLHTARVGVINERHEELLFVGIGINAPDDGDVHLDILGRDRQQAVAIAVAAAVVIQRKDAGRTGDIPLPFQLSLVHLLPLR